MPNPVLCKRHISLSKKGLHLKYMDILHKGTLANVAGSLNRALLLREECKGRAHKAGNMGPSQGRRPLQQQVSTGLLIERRRVFRTDRQGWGYVCLASCQSRGTVVLERQGKVEKTVVWSQWGTVIQDCPDQSWEGRPLLFPPHLCLHPLTGKRHYFFQVVPPFVNPWVCDVFMHSFVLCFRDISIQKYTLSIFRLLGMSSLGCSILRS